MQKGLFEELNQNAINAVAPLAVKMRPSNLSEIAGQTDALGPGTWLRNAIETDTLSSLILFGPAGCGKTSLAHVIAMNTSAVFVEVSAISGTVADLRKEIDEARNRLIQHSQKTILFIDEIHRFNRSQQDALLHAVEDRLVILIGATTENPFFEVNSALISRSRVVELKRLEDAEIEALVQNALKSNRGLNGNFAITKDALAMLIALSGGDARGALSTLELASELALKDSIQTSAKTPKKSTEAKPTQAKPASAKPTSAKSASTKSASAKSETNQAKPTTNNKKSKIHITAQNIKSATPHRALPYDKNKDSHYDTISAFIKSMRGSDPDAALYWLARMIAGGEDPKFIARRIFICASEDIGNADPQALLIAEATFKSCEVIGYPECRINLAQAAVYMALAPKSNASYNGINRALQEVQNGPLRPVPDHLRDRNRPGAENYGEYLYPHDYAQGWVFQKYLPDGLEPGCFYTPNSRGWEASRCDSNLAERYTGR